MSADRTDPLKDYTQDGYGETTAGMRAAFAALHALPDEERLRVMTWFCRGCGCYQGPDDRFCQCENDE